MERLVIKHLLREGLLNEGKVYPYKLINEPYTDFAYSFDADGIEYVVYLSKTSSKGTVYDLAFGIIGQDVDYRTKRDLSHLNNILTTVDAIMKDVIYEKRMLFIQFHGAREENEKDISIRSKAYLRYLKSKHPNAKTKMDSDGNVLVDCESIYPELYKNNNTI